MYLPDPFQSLYRKNIHEGSAEPSERKAATGPGYFSFRGIPLSRVGFGGYRIGLGEPGQKRALELALDSGVNLIDVSANYGDGEAEALVGAVLDEQISSGKLDRKNIFIVTKAGYIQGKNLKVIESRDAERKSFSEITRYQNGLFHCISPDFLEDQLERSRKRLGLASIDVFLLHNPEYFLTDSEKKGAPRHESHKEYYRRIREAFLFLESAKKSGKIRFYGISSNTFPVPEEEYTHTSLSKCLQISEEIGGSSSGFAVVQFPANWFEDGFLRNRNSEGKTLLDLCSNYDLLPLVNRPLNSFRAGEGMVRLSYSPEGSGGHADSSKLLQTLELESSILEKNDPESTFKSLSSLWDEYGARIQTEEQFQMLLERSWIPMLRKSIEQIDLQSGRQAAEEYIHILNTALPLLEERIRLASSEKLSHLYDSIASRFYSNTEAPKTLSSMMVFQLASLLGKGTVLLGMRTEKYVRDILPIFEKARPEIDPANWGAHGV